MLSLSRLMQQLKNILIHITLNQTQSEGHRNEETQQHQDIENRSINKIDNQPIEFRQKQQGKFTQI